MGCSSELQLSCQRGATHPNLPKEFIICKSIYKNVKLSYYIWSWFLCLSGPAYYEEDWWQTWKWTIHIRYISWSRFLVYRVWLWMAWGILLSINFISCVHGFPLILPFNVKSVNLENIEPHFLLMKINQVRAYLILLILMCGDQVVCYIILHSNIF